MDSFDDCIIVDPKVLEQNKELNYLREKIKLLESDTKKNIQYISDDTILEKQVTELLAQFNDLQEEKLDLETRFTSENTRFFELVEKLRDKLKLIALSTIEMDGKIRILNSKVPELEDAYLKQDQTIDNLVFKFKNASLGEIKNLETSLRKTEENIKYLENEILKTKKKNSKITWEIDSITKESLQIQSKYEHDKERLQGNINKLEKDNEDLEKKMGKLAGINKDTYDRKMDTLRKEIDGLTNQIRKTKNEKELLYTENENLKKEVKKLVLQKVSNEANNV